MIIICIRYLSGVAMKTILFFVAVCYRRRFSNGSLRLCRWIVWSDGV